MAKKQQAVTRSTKIGGDVFTVPSPYKEGHTVNTNEAAALNQTYAENIGNNLRQQIAKAKEDGASHDDLQSMVDEYAKDYTLAARNTRSAMTPRERISNEITRDYIRDRLAAAGRKISSVPAEALKAEQARLAALPEFSKAIDERLASQEASKNALKDVQLGDLPEASEE